ncbi:precorrin-4 C(11)-methyltransferase [Desulfuribacillus stibiiarsenatis]|uniref:Precorrin-4 C(11)-methyltransferase n=1 Tax=Desulfuribacillus stibiiarsenatis TaxID=1390249 RepID=A0A1E5L3U3_9FIRM|nr:precorrin-4 C(11)-methyltransferase [Desulfuribacillus stibiiarsenatis]OEH84756.1 precorrin-4 C(11)-methyltransferase [Desulfuribacillus stibiiarsenatis]
MSTVMFVGAGPGDIELITLKGLRALQSADIIIWAGSLINPEILTYAKKDAVIFNSATMNLQEIVGCIVDHYNKGYKVVRLHTGDPSIFGAIDEQIRELRRNNIPIEVIPGVSSFTAAAASIQKELTLPEVSQTIIISRISGKTPVPNKEDLALLSMHQATMCIFLSVHYIQEVVDKLLAGYPESTPIFVVEKASWPEQRIVKGTLNNIAEKVKEAEIKKTAMILVGNALNDELATCSLLYDQSFQHEFRTGVKL